MAHWEHWDALIDCVQHAPLDVNRIANEDDLQIQIARTIDHWIKEEGLPLQVWYYSKKRGQEAGLDATPQSPFPVFCMGSSSWPDLAVYPIGTPDQLLHDRERNYLAAIETKILGKKKPQGEKTAKNWLWSGIGQALINGLAYRHSLVFLLDLRDTGTSVELNDPEAIQSLWERGGVSVVVR